MPEPDSTSISHLEPCPVCPFGNTPVFNTVTERKQLILARPLISPPTMWRWVGCRSICNHQCCLAKCGYFHHVSLSNYERTSLRTHFEHMRPDGAQCCPSFLVLDSMTDDFLLLLMLEKTVYDRLFFIHHVKINFNDPVYYKHISKSSIWLLKSKLLT